MVNIRIRLVSFLISNTFHTPINNLMQILDTISDEFTVSLGTLDHIIYTPENTHITPHEIPFHKHQSLMITLLRFFFFQWRITLHLLEQRKQVDYHVFFMEGLGIIPMMILRLLGHKIIWMLPSSIHIKDSFHQNNQKHLILILLQKLSARLSYKIILYSPNLITEWHLESFKEKIIIAHEHCINLDEFTIKKDYQKRQPIIGHIGRFSEEKGTMNFLRSIPGIIKEHPDARFFIGGDGPLREDIDDYIQDHHLEKYIQRSAGWIPKDQLPDTLNTLQLLVLPSYTEGLPNMMLEAMACGTPILATSVGSIPDVITDTQTGFLLKDETPETITNHVLTTLHAPELSEISAHAYQYIQNHFTLDQSIQTFARLFAEISDPKTTTL